MSYLTTFRRFGLTCEGIGTTKFQQFSQIGGQAQARVELRRKSFSIREDHKDETVSYRTAERFDH